MDFLTTLADWFRPSAPPDPAILEAIDHIDDLLSPLLRAEPDFEKQMIAPIQSAMIYCGKIIETLPGPFSVTRHAFATDPLVHALFATADAMDGMLGESQSVRDFLQKPESFRGESFYGVLAARRCYKKQLGLVQTGEIIHRDMPQEVLYFTDHLLVEPHADIEGVLRRLRFRALESLAVTFNQQVDALRASREKLRLGLTFEQAQLKTLSRQASSLEAAQRISEQTKKINGLEEEMRLKNHALMPENILATLFAFLQVPEKILCHEMVTATVDRLGVLREEGSEVAEGIDRLQLPEITTRDGLRFIAVLVKVSRAEAEEAVSQVRHRQGRYMMI